MNFRNKVVAVALIEAGEVNLVLDQPAQGVLKVAWHQLPFKVNGKEARAGVDGFVAGHAGVP